MVGSKTERNWLAVAPVAFTANGTTLGVVTVSDTIGFFTKQVVFITTNTSLSIRLQIKRVLSPTQIIVGPVDNKISISNYTDISAYTTALLSAIGAQEQPDNDVPEADHYSAIYASDPIVADRVIPVDPYGQYYTDNNPLPVAFEGTVSIGSVEIKGSPSGDLLNVNADGSINVNVVETPVTGHTVKNIYNEITNVASGVKTTIVSYTVPFGKTGILERITTSGDNVGRYDVYLNGSSVDTQRTYFGGNFNALFEFITGTGDGFVLSAGDIITVTILHTRPFVGMFESRIQVLEIA